MQFRATVGAASHPGMADRNETSDFDGSAARGWRVKQINLDSWVVRRTSRSECQLSQRQIRASRRQHSGPSTRPAGWVTCAEGIRDVMSPTNMELQHTISKWNCSSQSEKVILCCINESTIILNENGARVTHSPITGNTIAYIICHVFWWTACA